MNRIAGPLLASALLLCACGTDKSENPAPKPAPAPAPAPAPVPAPDPVKPPANATMDEAIKTLMAKAEQPDASIEIQHILISFQGAPRMRGVTRSTAEAKVLAEKVYAEAIGGADFLELVKKYTNDSAPGIYPLTKAGRGGYVKGFGDVGFRLKLGEIGVAPFDKLASPFGWHIIKRVK